MPVDTPFSRLNHPDLKINGIVQDIYNKLQQIQGANTTLSASINTTVSKIQATTTTTNIQSSVGWKISGSLLITVNNAYNVIVGRSTDDGSGSKFQVAGRVSVQDSAIPWVTPTISYTTARFNLGGFPLSGEFGALVAQALVGEILIPATSNGYVQGAGVVGYSNTNSTTTASLGCAGYASASTPGASSFGGNFVASGYAGGATHLLGCESDNNPRNAGDTCYGFWASGSVPTGLFATPVGTAYAVAYLGNNPFAQPGYESAWPWAFGFQVLDGCAGSAAFDTGCSTAAASNVGSMQNIFRYRTPGGVNGNIVVNADPSGNLIWKAGSAGINGFLWADGSGSAVLWGGIDATGITVYPTAQTGAVGSRAFQLEYRTSTPALGVAILNTDTVGNLYINAGNVGTTTVVIRNGSSTVIATFATALVSVTGTVDVSSEYHIASTAGFRLSGGQLQWSNDLATWNSFSSVVPTSTTIAYASADLSLTNSYQDVTGATITLGAAGTYLIIGVFDFLLAGAGDAGQTLSGRLVANGSAQTQITNMTSASAGDRSMNTQQWVYTSSGAGEVVKLQAQKNGGTGTSAANHPGTSISASRLA